MKRNRTLLIIALILLFVGIPMILSAAERARISPLGIFNLQDRELKAPLKIKQTLQTLRGQIAAQKLTFEVGYTAAADFPLSQLATLKAPADLSAQIKKQNALALLQLKKFVVPVAPICSAGAASYDWRKGGGSTPVKDQGGCGSCWDFATLGAFEGSWRIINHETVNASEQDVLDCSGAGSCAGGWWAFNYLINKKVAAEVSYPYTAVKGACKAKARPYGAAAWGYVGTDHNIPSVAALKQALCAHGPLAVAVNATSAFQHYTGGVFNEHNTTKINHGVTLIGWSDSKKAWLVKNSWGTGWGSTCDYGTERGYIWIAYGSNNIGYAAAWTKAVKK
jgi:cathepsin L